MSSSSAIESGRAYVKIFTEDSALVKGLRGAQQKLRAFGSTVQKVGAGMMAGAAVFTAPLLGAAKAFADAGSMLNDASVRTGVSVESLSELQYAAKQTGVEFEGLEGGLRLMQKTIGQGGKKFEELANKVGIPMAKLKSMTPEQQFLAIGDAISKSVDPTKRAALAMQAFGKQGAALLPMFDEGAAGLARMRKEARDLGLVMSGKDAAAADAFGDALDILWAQGMRIVQLFGAVAAPALTTFLKWTQPIIKSVIDWVDANRPLLANLAAIAAGVGAFGAAVLGAGVGIQAVGFAISPLIGSLKGLEAMFRITYGIGSRLFGILGTPAIAIFKRLSGVVVQLSGALVALVKQGLAAFVSGLTSAGGTVAAMITPIGLIGAALAGIAAYAVYASGTFQVLWSEGATALSALWGIAKTSFDAIGNALANGNIVAAAAVLWSALQLAWVQGIRPLQMAWWTFKNFFLNVWTNAVFSVATVFTNAWAGIETVWRHTIDFFSDSWAIFTSGLMKAWYATVGFIKQAWVRLKKLFGVDINVDAEADRINKETAANQQSVDDARNKEIADREASRNKELNRIEDQRKGAVGALDATAERERQANQDDFDQSVAGADAKLKAANEAWRKSVEDANAAGAETPEAQQREGLTTLASKTGKKTKDQVNTALELGSSESLKAIVGAVSPEARLQRELRDAAKDTAKQTKTIADEAKKTNKTLASAPVLVSSRE